MVDYRITMPQLVRSVNRKIMDDTIDTKCRSILQPFQLLADHLTVKFSTTPEVAYNRNYKSATNLL